MQRSRLGPARIGIEKAQILDIEHSISIEVSLQHDVVGIFFPSNQLSRSIQCDCDFGVQTTGQDIEQWSLGWQGAATLLCRRPTNKSYLFLDSPPDWSTVEEP